MSLDTVRHALPVSAAIRFTGRPFQKFKIFWMLEEPASHHDCLEAVAIDCPRPDMCRSCEK